VQIILNISKKYTKNKTMKNKKSEKINRKGLNKFNKKAQIKIQEMSFVLIAVALFFILIGLFIVSIVQSNLYKKASDFAQEKAIASVKNFAYSPEFNYNEQNCIDADKLIGFVKKESQDHNYEKFWDFTSIKIIKESGFNKSEGEMIGCDMGNYPNCDIFILYDKTPLNEVSVSSYIALCKKEKENSYIYDKCTLAKFVIGSERKIP